MTYAPPAGAVRVEAGADIQAAVDAHPAGTAFLLSEGTYSGQSVRPRDGDAFYGENGRAVLDGGGAHHAFHGQGVSKVTLNGLVVTGYAPPANGIGALGTDAGSPDWVVQGCELHGISVGVAIALGTRMVVRDNLVRHNEDVGIGGWNVAGAVIEHNEVAFNNQSGRSPFTATGTAAGIKVAQVSGTRIANNHVHSTKGGVGVWTDLSCDGTVIEGNRIERNGGPGVLVELDYGAVVRNNLIEGNNDPALQNFQGGGIYIQNSSNAEVYGNTLRGNVGGVWLFENDRGSGTQGPWKTRNNKIYANLIAMSSGHNGLGGDAHLESSNVFYDNAYCLTGAAAFVIGKAVGAAQWRAQGHDTEASGSTLTFKPWGPDCP